MKKGPFLSSSKMLHDNFSIELSKKESWVIVWPSITDIVLWPHLQAPLPTFAATRMLAQVRYYFQDKEISFTHYKFLPKRRAILLKCCQFVHVGFG